MPEASTRDEARAEVPAPAQRPAGLWLPLGRIGPIAVHVDLLVLALVAFLLVDGEAGTLGRRLALIGVALGSVFLHEMGHALAARLRGLAVSGVYLHLVSFAYVQRGRPADELRVALAGPAMNLALAAALFALPSVHGSFPWTRADRWLDSVLHAAFGINLLIGVLNLLPALPADGGRALRAGLRLRWSAQTARRAVAGVGCLLAALVLAGAVALWPSTDATALAVLGAFLALVAVREATRGARGARG